MSSNRTFLQSVKVPVVLILFLSIIGTVGVGCQENNGVNQIETVIGVPVTNEPVESIDLIATELPTVTAVPQWNVTSVASVTLPTTPNTLVIPSATPITPPPFVAVTAARPNYYIEDTTNYMVYGSWLWHPDNPLATESLPIQTSEHSWSSDGRQLVGWNREFQKVAILTLATGDLTLLENISLTPGVPITPRWSPNNKYLLYTVIVQGNDNMVTSRNLAVYDLTTKQETILSLPTSLDNVIEIAGWSSDSSKIAYVKWEQITAESTYMSVIETVDIGTMEMSRLSGPPSVAFVEVIWSPVNDKFLIGAIAADSQTELSLGITYFTYHEIYLADIEGNRVEQLKGVSTHSVEGDTGELGGYYLSSTPWSSDGDAIIYSDAGLICYRNIILDEEVCMRELMTDIQEVGGIGAQYPSWSPTGEWISFILKHSNVQCSPIAAIRRDGSDLRFTNAEIGDCTVFNPIWSPHR